MTTPTEMVVTEFSIVFRVCSVIVASRHQDFLQVHLKSEVISTIPSSLLPLTTGDALFSLSHSLF